ncbi:MAG: DUF924 domain-containing protein [Deltaproteobacteria bacterium]|nr:MAG: DUF924 domain-containing protein [Deltaproteobacteria bacterium]
MDRDPIERLLDFWFGPLGDDGVVDKAHRQLWFAPNEEFDRRCREDFEADLARAGAGELDHWRTTPGGHLALILLLDQLSRNIYRGTARVFAQDGKALALCQEGLARGTDRALRPAERLFFYLPLEHAEDRAAQRRSVECFEGLCADVSPEQRPLFEDLLDYARRHRAVVERFGRFPHRNAILGRTSTPGELAFLVGPEAPF